MLISGRHFPIGNACNITILNYGAIYTITEDQIKAMSGHRSHDILVLTIAVPTSLSAKWTHVKKKQKKNTRNGKWLPHAGKNKGFFEEPESTNAY